MGLRSFSLDSWHAILIALAVEVGCLGPCLLFVSYLAKQRWNERILLIVPLAAFSWLLLIARDVQAQDTYWAHYLVFVADHYSPDTYTLLTQQTQQDYSSVEVGINSLGWKAVFITEAVVLYSGALLTRWYTSRRIKTTPPATSTPDASDGALEITIEPLAHPYSAEPVSDITR